PVDPLSASLPHSYPIGPRDRAAFFSLRDKRLQELDKVMKRGEAVPEMVMK
ncbi:MAG: hypothetical protein HY709_09705, partial [Candidatus Latescibacteria bacterium]|nr:hypothetical protein [Candidatus Latescibacterota bacterium]